MKNQSSLFRQEALREYIEGHEETILPRLFSPHIFVILWILVVLFLLTTVLFVFARFPNTVYGSAIVLPSYQTNSIKDHEISVIILLPETVASNIGKGQTFVMQTSDPAVHMTFLIMNLEPASNLDATISLYPTNAADQAILVSARMVSNTNAAGGLESLNGLYNIKVRIGEFRIYSLLFS